MTAILSQIDHRPYPPPDGPWVAGQHWDDLLFAHWPLPVEKLHYLVPAPLEIDTFDGEAWISAVPFAMANVRARHMPPFPGFSRFPELNLRTYVTLNDGPGVFFFSLDCSNRLMVAAARRLFSLPYYQATMGISIENGRYEFRSIRTHAGAPSALFRASYEPCGQTAAAEPDTLNYWLTERYRLYARRPDGVIMVTEVHHPAWQLQSVQAVIKVNTLNSGLGFNFPDDPPLLHFSKHQPVIAWRPEVVLSAPYAGRSN